MQLVKQVGLAILLFGMASVASAGPVEKILTGACQDISWLGSTHFCQKLETQTAPQSGPATVISAPEIDPASAIAGLTLLLGGIAVIRGRRVKTSKA